MNKQGVIAGMLTGLICSVSYIVYFRFLGGDPANYFLGISPQGIGFPIMILSFIIIFVVSYFYEDAPKEIQELVERIRYPK